MEIKRTEIPDIFLVIPTLHQDDRGFFMETFRQEFFEQLGLKAPFVQENHSQSAQGVIRGLHYQIHQPQGKLVRVVLGDIFDVAVDLRRSSPTFSRWIGVRLSAENKQQLWMPPGFAHGFQVMSEKAEVLYKTTDYYAPQWERILFWNDPRVQIAWPLQEGRPPIISARDANGKMLDEAETYA
jgi:dTDP-4-dehydrorhamnose 3,5-epimerase